MNFTNAYVYFSRKKLSIKHFSLFVPSCSRSSVIFYRRIFIIRMHLIFPHDGSGIVFSRILKYSIRTQTPAPIRHEVTSSAIVKLFHPPFLLDDSDFNHRSLHISVVFVYAIYSERRRKDQWISSHSLKPVTLHDWIGVNKNITLLFYQLCKTVF